MLFESQAHGEALTRLHLMLQNGSLGVLTGEVGAGKSTLIRHLISSLDPPRFQPVYLVQAGMRPKDFYGELLRHLGEETPYFLEKARLLFHKTFLQRSQSDSARKLIHSDTRGILRLINNLCTNALFTARQKGTEVIESELITRIIHDAARQRGLAT